MKLIPDEIKHEINLRLKALKEIMKETSTDVLLIGSNANVYYTTGRFFRGFVYVAAEGPDLWFVIRPDYFEQEENVIAIRKPEEIPGKLQALGIKLPSSIGLEDDTLSYSEIIRLQRIFPESSFSNASTILKKTRMVKTDYEIDLMKADGIHQVEAYKKIHKCFKPGMTDLEFQIEIERILRLEGCLGVIRTSGNFMDINLGSVIAGDNADNPGPYDFTMGGAGVDPSLPVGANGMMIKYGETVMIDMNGSFNGYQTDMTRVWKLGEVSDLAVKAHECSRKILRHLEKIALPGLPVSSLYDEALDIVKTEGFEDYFMGHKSKVSFIGHGVGIELNEPPVIMKKSRDVLKERMTLAIEPKFVIPGVGAVGVENTYVVRDSGLENITVYDEGLQEL